MRRSLLPFLLFIAASALADEWVPRAVLMPVQSSTPQLAETALQIESTLRVRMINSRQTEVVDQALTNIALIEEGLNPADIRSTDQVFAVADRTRADIVVVTTLSALGTTRVIRAVVYSVLRRQEIAAFEQSFVDDAYRPAVNRINQLISTSVITIQTVTLRDIATLLDIGSYEEAWRMQSVYLLTNEPSPESVAIERDIRRSLANRAYENSQKLSARYLFDDALEELSLALYYTPDDPMLTEAVNRVRAEQVEFESVQLEEVTEAIEELMLGGSFESAAYLLSVAADRGLERSELSRLERRLSEGVREEQRYNEALQLYWSGRYAQSLAITTELTTIAPDNTAYQELAQSIRLASRGIEDTRAVWDEYRRSIERINLVAIAGVHRIPLSGLSVGVGSIRTEATDTLSQQVIRIPGWGLHGGYQWRHVVGTGIVFPFVGVSLHYGAEGTLRIGRSEEVTPVTPGVVDVHRQSVLGLSVGPIGMATVSIMSLSLSLGVSGQLGWVHHQSLERRPNDNVDSSNRAHSFTLDLPYVLEIGWTPSPRQTVFLRVTTTLTGAQFPVAVPETEKPMARSTTFGVRWGH